MTTYAPNRAQRLGVVLEMAERAEKKAAEVYDIAMRTWRADAAQLDELRSYYREYAGAFDTGTGRAIRASEIARQRAFLQKLSDAIAQQAEVVAQRDKLAESKKALWHKAHLKHCAMRDLVKRIRADERRALDRKEEKMLEEWFAQSQAGRVDAIGKNGSLQ